MPNNRVYISIASITLGRLPMTRPSACSPPAPARPRPQGSGPMAGGRAAAIAYTLIETAKLNGIDPSGWLADTLARIPDYKITKIDDLLPWRWSR